MLPPRRRPSHGRRCIVQQDCFVQGRMLFWERTVFSEETPLQKRLQEDTSWGNVSVYHLIVQCWLLRGGSFTVDNPAVLFQLTSSCPYCALLPCSLGRRGRQHSVKDTHRLTS